MTDPKTEARMPRDLVLILRTEAKNQRTPPINYVIAEDGGRMVHRPEPDIAMAELLEEAADDLASERAAHAETNKLLAGVRDDAMRADNELCAMEARIAELAAEVERLRRLVMAQSRAIHSPESLSRTGAVKPLEWRPTASGYGVEAHTILGKYWVQDGQFWAPNCTVSHPYRTDEAAKAGAQEHFNAAVSSALAHPPAHAGAVTEAQGWREIDLSRGAKSDHPDISTEKQYLVKVHGGWFFGRFSRQWYGLSFDNWGRSGCQFDTPGYNSSTWERVIEIDPETLPTPPEQAVTDAARAVCDNAKLVDIGKNGAFNYVVSPYLIDALKAAMEARR